MLVAEIGKELARFLAPRAPAGRPVAFALMRLGQGEGKLVDMLKRTAIPLRVYGKWSELNYSLQVDQILRRQLQNEAKRRLNDWAERNKNTQSGKDVQKLLNK